jgi:hypothetical protein
MAGGNLFQIIWEWLWFTAMVPMLQNAIDMFSA